LLISRVEKLPYRHRKFVENQLNRISKTVQEKRENAGITQEELAERLDILAMTIRFIEQRRRFPSLPVLFCLCKELDIPFQIGE
jgi:transcriptional regulator with XRE-family HTH domain